MPHVTSWERRGMRIATQNVIVEYLALHFGPVPDEVVARIKAITDETRLNSLVHTAIPAGSLEQFQQSLEA